MTFEEVKEEYLLRIGQAGDSGSLEEDAQHIRRIRKAYNDLCRDTGATWKKPQLVSLSAVTSTTNYHDLSTATTGLLALSTGYSIYDVHRVFWKSTISPRRLSRWNKEAIDERNFATSSTGTNRPLAYGVWSERVSNADVWYIAFYPFINAAVTDKCYISYWQKPPAPAVATWGSNYPEFLDGYHEVIAELAALRYKEDRDIPVSRERWLRVSKEIQKLKDKYNPMTLEGEAFNSFLKGDSGYGMLRYGEWVTE